MNIGKIIWENPVAYLRHKQPDHPISFFAPKVLAATFQNFRQEFPGLVTYAVKANADPVVLENLVTAGLKAFDVASPAEIKLVRGILPDAVLHYNNPVRSVAEVKFAASVGVASFSVDNFSELAKLAMYVPTSNVEIAVRLKLPVAGAAYDFGAKFGADPQKCAEILTEVDRLGFIPSLSFHPGTQCTDPSAWENYIFVAADIAEKAGIRLKRLNVGGGFPSHRQGEKPDLQPIFTAISSSVAKAFGSQPPSVICEPGRAMVAEALTLAPKVKAIIDSGDIFLNDGLYGGLAELPTIEANARIKVYSSNGAPVSGPRSERIVFGPTCDSIDMLPETAKLPDAIKEGDYVLFQGMGAYSTAITTGFNGYGQIELVTVQSLST